MKTFDLFVIELDKQIEDTVTTAGGLELYVDNRFREFDLRKNEAPVVATPFKYDTGVEVGDTLYFHHLVVLNEGQPLTGMENNFLVRYNADHAISNQAIAYKSKKDGVVRPLGGWAILSPIEEEKESIKEGNSGLVTVELKEKPTTKAKLAFESEETKRMGLKVGDVIGFEKNIDYRFKIDGQEYIRIPEDRFLYVEVQDS